jgi:MFS family permease
VPRRRGREPSVGLSLACFAAAALCYRIPAVPSVLAGAALDGVGSVWLAVGVMTAAQRYSPLALQGRVSAAVSMAITGPQTISIAAGTILISIVDYRVLLIGMAVLTGGCALVLLTRPRQTMVSSSDRAVLGTKNASAQVRTKMPADSQ